MQNIRAMYRNQSFQLFAIILSAFLVRIILLNLQWNDPVFSVQQDNYADYAYHFDNGSLLTRMPIGDRRLFPGYPLLISLVTRFCHNYVLAGVSISILASLVSIYLLYLITGSIVATTLFAFFPPIWLDLGTKVATEPLAVVLILTSLFLLKKGKIIFAGVLVGLSSVVRLIGFMLLVMILSIKNQKQRVTFLIPMLVVLFIFLVYNQLYITNSATGNMFDSYLSVNQVQLGMIAIFKDIARTIDWNQYQILGSFMFYFCFVFLGTVGLFLERENSSLSKWLFWWCLASLGFVFGPSPTTIIDDFSRYIVPFSPGLVYGLSLLLFRICK